MGGEERPLIGEISRKEVDGRVLLQGFGFFVSEGRVAAFLIEKPKWRVFGNNGKAAKASQRRDTRQLLGERGVRMIEEEQGDRMVEQDIPPLRGWGDRVGLSVA